jgi:hypothetical protein
VCAIYPAFLADAFALMPMLLSKIRRRAIRS